MKWTYEELFEKWNALVLSSTSQETFRPARDALIESSGWTKSEFYTEFDRREFEKYTKPSTP